MFAYCGNNPVVRVDGSGRFFMLVAGLVGAAVGAVVGAAVAAATGGDVLKGALIGGLTGGVMGLTCGAAASVVATGTAFASTSTVLGGVTIGTASLGGMAATGASASWAASAASATTKLWRAFEKWYCEFNNIVSKYQQVNVPQIGGRLDAITNSGKIIELKCYNWSCYQSYGGIINKFIEQGDKYSRLIGTCVEGIKIKEILFYFSSMPPQKVIDALKEAGYYVDWVQ